MADADHVFTQDELVKDLTTFSDALSDDVKASLDPEVLGSLETISEGIGQAYQRIDNLNQTIANLQKVTEDYKAKIAAYASEQADRIAQSVKKDDEDEDVAQTALDKIKEDDD